VILRISNEKQSSVNDLEAICIFITTYKLEAPDEKEIGKAVDELLSEFRFIRTLNPLVWVFIGRWRTEITKKSNDRITRLVDNLKSVECICSVTPSYTWTSVIKQHELTWKAWREVIY